MKPTVHGKCSESFQRVAPDGHAELILNRGEPFEARYGAGADWPLSRKFGCDGEEALRLARTAARCGLQAGISFHVGSQQRDPGAWDAPLAEVARIFQALRRDGVTAPHIQNSQRAAPIT